VRPVRVLVVGDVALDVLVTPATAPVPGADVPARIRTRPGGAGANTAAWLAHLGRNTGIAVTLAARVGDDPAGQAAAADLDALGGTQAVLHRVRAVAVSAGAAGASWVDPGVRCTAAAPEVAVVDATGAGDAFDAGVLVAWLDGATPAAALAAGCAAGAAAVSRIGARP
jgi:sugar/nucleoside kinase (ribokinase family)